MQGHKRKRLLAEMAEAGERDPGGKGAIESRPAIHPAIQLKDLGITLSLSSRWQQSATVLRGELDTRVFPRVLDFGEGLNGPSDRAIAAFHALYGGQVDTGLLGTLVRRPTPDRAHRANLFRSQHALAEFHQIAATLQ